MLFNFQKKKKKPQFGGGFFICTKLRMKWDRMSTQ